MEPTFEDCKGHFVGRLSNGLLDMTFNPIIYYGTNNKIRPTSDSVPVDHSRQYMSGTHLLFIKYSLEQNGKCPGSLLSVRFNYKPGYKPCDLL